MDEGADQSQQHPEAKPRRKRDKKPRWGEETEVGQKVLEEMQNEPQANTEIQDAEEPGAKRRKSRWGPEDQKAPVPVIPGLPAHVNLPASLAHLVDFNPESLELQRQLNAVGACIAAFYPVERPCGVIRYGRHAAHLIHDIASACDSFAAAA